MYLKDLFRLLETFVECFEHVHSTRFATVLYAVNGDLALSLFRSSLRTIIILHVSRLRCVAPLPSTGRNILLILELRATMNVNVIFAARSK